MKSDEAGRTDLLELARERFIAELELWCEKNGVLRCELDDRWL